MKNKPFILSIIAIVCLFSTGLKAQPKKNHRPHRKIITCLQVNMPGATDGDTLRLFVYGKFISAGITIPAAATEKIATVSKGIAVFKLPDVTKATYFTLSKEKMRDTAHFLRNVPILYQYFIEPGDNVTLTLVWDSTYHADQHTVNWTGHGAVPEIVFHETLKYVKQYKFLFSGFGAAKYQLRAALDKIDESSFLNHSMWDQNGLLTPSPKLAKGLSLIDTYRDKISPLAYQILQADWVGQDEKSRLKVAWFASPEKRTEALKVHINTFPDSIMLLSRYYTDFLEYYYAFKYRTVADHTTDGAYFHIKADYPEGELRDKIITYYLYEENSLLDSAVLKDAIHAVKTPFYLSQVLAIYNSMESGHPAFDFSLPDEKGNIVHLSDFKGKVVFIDFWYTGCGNCVYYYKNIVNETERNLSGNNNVVFISISIDTDRQTWLKSIESDSYTSEAGNVINLYTGGKGTTHEVIEKYKVWGYPRPLIIDKNGRVFTSKDTDLRVSVNNLTKIIELAMK